VKLESESREEKIWLEDLSASLVSLEDTGEMIGFLREMLTEAELRNMVLRWRLMIMLREGHSQRSIASRLGISLCKITRGSRILKKGGSVTSRLLDSHQGHRRVTEKGKNQNDI